MKPPTVLPVQFAPLHLSLDDVFALRLNSKDSGGRVGGVLEMEPENAGRWNQWVGTSGQLSDTPFAAAWLLLQARWLGTPETVLHEAAGDGPAHGRTAIAAAFDSDQTASSWLAMIDKKRRTAEAASSEATPNSLWLSGNASAAGTPAPLHLWLPPCSMRPRRRNCSRPLPTPPPT
jgi:hypothetical protein